jgi:hypothetical protein
LKILGVDENPGATPGTSERKASVTISEPALICGFFARMPFRRFLNIVTKIFYFMKKSMTYLYVQNGLFSGLKLTILGEYFS